MIVIKQNVGVDISKESFMASFVVLFSNQEISHKGIKKFENTKSGIASFRKWIKHLSTEGIEIHITLESTGVYHELLAHMLNNKDNIILHIELPNKVKKYNESLDIKAKTDKIDSKNLGRLGIERTLKQWKLSPEIFLRLKVLTREKLQLIKERTMIKNQLHAYTYSAKKTNTSVTRSKNRIKYIEKQIESIEKEIKKEVSKDENLSKKIKKIQTVPGLGFFTIVSVIAETEGFANVKSIKQLTSYSGYDVVIKESGKWKGKSRISKKGNSNIRYYLHMPSLSAIQHSQTYKRVYERIMEKKEHKMIGIVAVQRKLLGLIYTLWKNDTEYIENYQNENVA